jgi:hypothetical protein
MAAGMFWDVGWSLVLGFTISAVIQAVVSTEQMRRALGRDGVREIALATLAGADSEAAFAALRMIVGHLCLVEGPVRVDLSRSQTTRQLPAPGISRNCCLPRTAAGRARRR